MKVIRCLLQNPKITAINSKINKNIIELWTIKQLLDACLAKI